MSTVAQTPLEDIEESLKDVIDPELGINIVDLGLLYGLNYAEDGALIVDMTLTTAACPLTDVIEAQVGRAVETMVDEWRLNWVWMPPWGAEKITEDRRAQMRALGFNIESRTVLKTIRSSITNPLCARLVI